jgi:hypothetical protein
MTPIWMRSCSVCGKTRPACRRSARFAKRPRRPARHSCRAGCLAAAAARRVQGASPGSAPGGLAPGLRRVAPPPPQGSSAGRSGGARHQTALFGAGARPLRHAPQQAAVGAGRTAGQPSPPRALAGPGGPALPDAAPMQRPQALRAGADGGTAPTAPGVHGASPSAGLRRRYDLPSHGRRLVIARRRAGSGCARRGRGGDGQPSADRARAPGLGTGDRAAAACSRPHDADGSWESVGR